MRFAAWPLVLVLVLVVRVLVRLQAQPVQAVKLAFVFSPWPQAAPMLVCPEVVQALHCWVRLVQCPPPTGSAPQTPPRAERRRQS